MGTEPESKGIYGSESPEPKNHFVRIIAWILNKILPSWGGGGN